MVKSKVLETRSIPNLAIQLTFTAILFALAAGVIGTIVNRWLIGWVLIGGLAGVCLVFMALGVLTIATRLAAYNDKLMLNGSQLAAGAGQLHMEPESHSHVSAPNVLEFP